MIYVLIMVVLGGGNLGATQPMRVGLYRSLATCQSAATDAKSTGFDNGTVGFVCVRVVGEAQQTITERKNADTRQSRAD